MMLYHNILSLLLVIVNRVDLGFMSTEVSLVMHVRDGASLREKYCNTSKPDSGLGKRLSKSLHGKSPTWFPSLPKL